MQRRSLQGGLACALFAVFVGGCAGSATQKQAGVNIEEDVGRIVKLPDGSTCTEPVELSASREAPGGQLATKLLASEEKVDDALAKEADAKLDDAGIEAAYFDVCRAYSKNEIKKDAFEKLRRNYLDLRQALLAQGIKAWIDKKDGIKDPGKLCMAVFGGDPSGAKNFTRQVPDTTSVDDCALYATRAGAGDVLLGCTEGQWKNHWARKTVAAGPLGMKSRGQIVRDTQAAPEPNCGWL